MFGIRIDVPNQDRMFQLRIWCSKSGKGILALDPKKLQSVNFIKVNLFSKKGRCSKSGQGVPNQGREFQIRIYVLNQDICSKSGYMF